VSNLNGPAACGVSEATSLRLAIIGCGNPARSDDGAGIEVIRLLAEAPVPPGVALIDAGTSGMDVMFRVRGARRVAIFRLPAREVMTPTEHGYSLHGLRWDHAIYAGCRIFGADFADHAEVVLIESRELGFGLELSDPVQRAARSVAAMLAPLIAGHG